MKTPDATDHHRRAATGSICPTCRLAADLGIEHPCITAEGWSAGLLMVSANREQYEQLQRELRQHPALPYVDDDEPVKWRMQGPRQVHRSWCFCGCGPMATPDRHHDDQAITTASPQAAGDAPSLSGDGGDGKPVLVGSEAGSAARAITGGAA